MEGSNDAPASHLWLEMMVPINRHNKVETLIGGAILGLPSLVKEQVTLEDNCGICLQSFGTILEDESLNGMLLELEGGQKVELSGVTKLEGCGHVFCRLDLIEWIKGHHGTCPACRHQFLEIPSQSDVEESEPDEDYIPEDDDFDSDGFTDADDWELDADEMDLDEPEELGIEDDAQGRYGHELQEECGVGRGGDTEGEDPGLSDSFGSEPEPLEEALATVPLPAAVVLHNGDGPRYNRESGRVMYGFDERVDYHHDLSFMEPKF
ncbi:hypothetical protein BXZ70DRAFT_1061436 [Cristinia sonorae]|uniref:RING-type domain-containing protein n=1 Tax=Cristinia sonorae TaxID=1940300 RepID=A0A8K0XTL1_9AGAR|nr:hypothetical protein BXZ70DRAFT_1061436 [Cristinia sonorae]